MLNVFESLFSVFFRFLKIPLIIVAALFLFIIIYIFCFNFYFRKVKKMKPAEIKKRYLYEPDFFMRVFFYLPYQFILDGIRTDPQAFTYKGVVIFTGKQGNGKSIAMTKFVSDMQSEFPRVKVIDNYGYLKSDNELTHWSQLIDYNNGIYGVIAAIDETQNWFSCKQSKDFPPEMLEVITQNRKNRRIIVGTAQNFSNLAKDIRRQCTEVRECKTYFGCLTIVKRREPVMDSEGNVEEYINRGRYFFVQSDELREMYDTWKCIKALKESGFVSKSSTTINVNGSPEPVKKKFFRK